MATKTVDKRGHRANQDSPNKSYINDLIKVSLTFSQLSLIAYADDYIIISKDLNQVKLFIKLAKQFFKMRQLGLNIKNRTLLLLVNY